MTTPLNTSWCFLIQWLLKPERNEHIDEEIISLIVEWLSNPSHTKGIQNQYLCIVDLYCHNKTLITKALNDKEDTNNKLSSAQWHPSGELGYFYQTQGHGL